MTIQIPEGFKKTEIGLIPEEWEVVRLADKISYNPKRLLKKGVLAKAVAMADIKEYKKNITQYEIKEFKGGTKFLNEDTLVARITPCLENGKTAFVNILSKDEVGFGSTEFIVLRGIDNITDNKYVYYLSISDNFRDKAIKSMSGTSGRQRVQNDVLQNKLISLPSLNEQKAIAEVLSSLDDKIELLEKQNKTLENIGQAIFKSWFVDFEGFEDDLVESEMGMIPRGWKVGKIKDYINFIVDNRGKTPATILPGTEGIIPMIEINSLIGGGRNINIELIKKGVTEEVYNSWFRKGHPERGDVLFSTVGSIGEIGLVYDEKICIAQNIVSLRPNVGGEYLYELLKNIKPNLLGLDISTVQPSIKLPHLLNFEVLIPNDKVITNFINTTKDNSEKIYTNKKQIQSLNNLRDSILPRLMNGKLRVNK